MNGIPSSDDSNMIDVGVAGYIEPLWLWGCIDCNPETDPGSCGDQPTQQDALNALELHNMLAHPGRGLS